MITRADILLESVDRNARIIEIGAGYSPVAPKRDGWNTKILDVGTRAELVGKYQGVSTVDLIEEVDFVWREGPLISAVPPEYHGSFDALVACGVIEHQPDMIAFLECAEKLLKSTGIVVLAIPDKRFCFDYFLPPTLLGDILTSHRLGHTRHSPQTTFNFGAYSVTTNYALVWGQHSIDGVSFAFLTTLEDAYEQFLNCDESHSSPYVDMHAWQFTPANFQLIMLELARLGLTDWRVDRIAPTIGFEFHIWLRRGARRAVATLNQAQLDLYRLALLKRTIMEAKEQLDFLNPAGLLSDPERVKTENEMLRAERSALLAKLEEQVALYNAANSERHAAAAAAAKWFEAVVAATASNDPLAIKPSGRKSWLDKAKRRLIGNHGESPVVLGDRARETGKWELAVRYYRDALSLQPDQPKVLTKLGHSLREAGKIVEAEIAYRKALELDVDDSDTRAALAGTLAMQGKSIEPYRLASIKS